MTFHDISLFHYFIKNTCGFPPSAAKELPDQWQSRKKISPVAMRLSSTCSSSMCLDLGKELTM
jgi:hypothetical protein